MPALAAGTAQASSQKDTHLTQTNAARLNRLHTKELMRETVNLPIMRGITGRGARPTTGVVGVAKSPTTKVHPG
ncbi:hypothetical protein GCM10010278_23560 [Streptomyces melanogenes]|nr:hypothetical protein GCM10010278_23560 [Streptomyces melanogenes]